MSKSILIIAGEASGDNVGGLLCEELRNIDGDIELFGLGGDKMRAVGVKIMHHIDRLSFLGFWEIIKHIPYIRSVERDLLIRVENQRPSLAILIDYPGFNLRIAGKLKERGIPILYYVSPQVWAWGKKRIQKIKTLIDKMIVVFEFEKELYAREGLEVEWYGHPLLDIVKPRFSKVEFYNKSGLREDQAYIGLFPGSRLQEVTRILPVMCEAVNMVRNNGLDLTPVIGGVGGIEDRLYRDIAGEDFKIVKGLSYDIMTCSDLNLVASGTATLECAILGRPLFVLYRTSQLTYLIAKKLIKIPDIGLVNVVAGKRIVPEFVQSECDSKVVARHISSYFAESSYRDRMKSNLEKVRLKLGESGSSRRVAESVMSMLSGA